jgi:hypothetical protein
MRASAFDELAFFGSIAASGVRALLIGRRALVILGLPVLTAAYDFWVAIDDVEAFNAVGAGFELWPTRPADEARRRGRYVLENDERVDVLVARTVSTLDGEVVEFERLWQRRRRVSIAAGVGVDLPSIDDLILTKRISARPKDLEDVRLLRVLKGEEP